MVELGKVDGIGDVESCVGKSDQGCWHHVVEMWEWEVWPDCVSNVGELNLGAQRSWCGGILVRSNLGVRHCSFEVGSLYGGRLETVPKFYQVMGAKWSNKISSKSTTKAGAAAELNTQRVLVLGTKSACDIIYMQK